MKNIIKELGYGIEDFLKRICGKIIPEKRLAVILTMLLIFTAGNIYFTVSSIHNWGKESERNGQLQMEHIKRLELRKDSINKELNDFNYEQQERE
jgi:hypothetical protein